MTNPAVSAASTPHLATPLPAPPVPPPPSGCSAVSPLASSGCVADRRFFLDALKAVAALQLVIDYAKRRPTASREPLADAAQKVSSYRHDLAILAWDWPYIRAAMPHMQAVLDEARDLYRQHHPVD